MDNWKAIPDTDYYASPDGKIGHLRSLSLRKDKKGYLTAEVRAEGRVVMRSVARMVATAFLGPAPSPSHQVNHKDGDKTNNALENLEWVTPKENMKHARDVLSIQRAYGEHSPLSKLTEAQVVDMRIRASGGESYRALALESGVHEETVSSICRGRQWVRAGGPVADYNRNQSDFNRRRTKLAKKDYPEVVRLVASGLSKPEVARKLSVSVSVVYKALRHSR